MSWLEIWAMLQVLAMIVPVVIIFGYIVYFIIIETIKQKMCKHINYYENRACHAICNRCGKDLGFIGTVREQRKNGL